MKRFRKILTLVQVLAVAFFAQATGGGPNAAEVASLMVSSTDFLVALNRVRPPEGYCAGTPSIQAADPSSPGGAVAPGPAYADAQTAILEKIEHSLLDGKRALNTTLVIALVEAVPPPLLHPPI